MLDLVQRINWNEYLLILTQGHPSLALQFLAVNGIIVAYWFMTRLRKRKYKQNSALLLPLLFLVGNFSVVTLGHRLAT